MAYVLLTPELYETWVNTYEGSKDVTVTAKMAQTILDAQTDPTKNFHKDAAVKAPKRPVTAQRRSREAPRLAPQAAHGLTHESGPGECLAPACLPPSHHSKEGTPEPTKPGRK